MSKKENKGGDRKKEEEEKSFGGDLARKGNQRAVKMEKKEKELKERPGKAPINSLILEKKGGPVPKRVEDEKRRSNRGALCIFYLPKNFTSKDCIRGKSV